MQHRPGILFILLSLFVALSANSARACGDSQAVKHEQRASKKSCCKGGGDKNASCCSEKTGACTQDHHGKNCTGHKGGGGCHCPCGTTTGSHAGSLIADFSSAFSPLSDSSVAVLRQAFYFAQHMPEAVYLSIWQPPKLGA